MSGFNAPAAIALAVTIGSCAPTGSMDLADEPYLRGAIESMIHRATASSIRVRPLDPAVNQCGIAATVDAETRYLERSAEGDAPAALSDLQIGDTVDVYVTGPIAESCPVQGYASSIVRIPGNDIDR